jgi:molybdate transport system substrate-binding protein
VSISARARATLFALLLCALQPAWADELNVAVAANFSAPLQRLATQFEHASGHKLLISAGSSGQLYAQITQGAPFDVFLSADSDKPKLLEAAGLAVTGSRFTYAIGTLALWSPKAGTVDPQGKVLQAGAYRYIGVADPQNAPYGAAAQQVLTTLGLWDILNRDKKVVFGENITQAWQFAVTGNVDLAFVALSQIVASDGSIGGSYWLPPQSMYAAIEQDAVVLAHGSHHAAAEEFARWLQHDPQALNAIISSGYHLAQP